MAEDAVKVASQNYKVILENDRVRVLEYRGKPGDKTAMHSHPDVIAVAIDDINVKFTLPDGQTIPAELKSGQAMFTEAMDHSTEHTSTSEGRVVLIELK